ncbi:hypothetical protein FQN54_000162 [Arachnomyces sp. PD_36]|nr:hypothetical protein FQN54_000162 [Arachnomyces sp. PD_36]
MFYERARSIVIGFLLGVVHLVNADVIYDPVVPPSYPLAVRNPYLSTWMPGSFVEDLPSSEPQFWAGQSLTWGIMARVDGIAYNLFGVPDPEDDTKNAVVKSAQYTATHSVFILQAGSADIKLDFLSPVSPSNYLRQSLPFSYLTVSAVSWRGSRVQIYSDIDDTWTGQSKDTEWKYETTDSTSVFSISAKDVETYTQKADMAIWGEAIFASRPSFLSTMSTQSGDRSTVRSEFVKHGDLSGDHSDWCAGGVVGISHDLGYIFGSRSATFAVGYIREKAINYLGEPYTGYYRASYPETLDAVSAFLDDYNEAQAESITLDSITSIRSKGVAGQKYSDIVTLSTRQAYAGIDITIPHDSLDTDDVLAFVKELSSDGNVNTIDVIFSAFPMYYVMDPEYIRLLLEPIMRYLKAGRWTHPYAIHDLGTHYPHAIGHDDQKAEPMPVEESGNLLILAYAYTIASGNTEWAEQYMSVLQGYADYLVGVGLDLPKQLSTNDAAGPLVNETNLAIKSAVGLKAFAKLSGLTNYSHVGEQFAHTLYNDGIATDDDKTHFVLQYTDHKKSWKIPFNLYADVLLDLHTFDQSAIDMGCDFYSSVRSEAGMALDNRQDWAKTDWNIWTAGTCTGSSRDMFIDDLWAFMTNGLNTWPFSDRYFVHGHNGHKPGVAILLRARPTVGGHFALVALEGVKSLSIDSAIEEGAPQWSLGGSGNQKPMNFFA